MLRSETRAACARSFALWQHATEEIMRRNSLTIACSRYMQWCYSSRTSRSWWITQSTPERLQQHPFLFATNHTDRTFFVWKLNSLRPPHPGHSTILLQSETRSACAQSFAPWQQATIETMRRNHSYYCLLALHIQCRYSSRTSCSWWITQSTPERLQQHHARATGAT